MERQKIALSNFLLEICPALLNCSRQSLQSLLAKEGDRTLQTFLIEQQQVLVVGREPVAKKKNGTTSGAPGTDAANTERPEELPADENDEEEQFRLFVELGFAAHALTRAYSVAFLKRPGFSLEEQTSPEVAEDGEAASSPADAPARRKTIGQQLAVLCCGFGDDTESSLDVTQLYMQRGLAPMLNVALTQKETEGPGPGGAQAGNGSASGPAEEGAAEAAQNKAATSSLHQTVNKKMAELLLAVQQAQQNVDIPLIQLPVDPVIEETVKAAQAAGRKATVEDLGDYLHNTGYLIALQNHVNRWIKDIQKVCRMQRDASTGSAAEEVNFWEGMERAILRVEEQLKTPEAELTLQVLKQTRKVFATMTFEQDAGLKQASDMVASVNILIRDFPVNDLLGATSVEQLTQAVRTVFMHLRKLKNAAQYPLSRAYHLVEALSRDLSQRLVAVLSQQHLLLLGFEEFEHATGGCSELFRTWEEEVRQFKEMVRDQAKKRGLSERPPAKLVCEHLVIQERIGELRQFRRQHHRLKEVISRVLSENAGGDLTAQKEVASAYELLQSVDVLDLSRAGQEAWEAARKAYDDRIDRVESQITARLRDRLGASTTSGEMFRVFSQFNALFFRPRVRGAIQEYQTTLLQQVKMDLRKLQESFLDGHQRVETLTMAEARDMAPVAGSIVWAKQLERRLEGLIKRIEDVLGHGWEQHVEGQKLRQDIDAFRQRLNQNQLFENWLQVVKDEKRLDTGDRIFLIRVLGGRGFELDVNFDLDLLTLFKEVRLLNTLQYRIPYSVKVMADEAKVLYPFVTTLRVVLRTYTEACRLIEGSPSPPGTGGMRTKSGESVAALLVASYQREAQQRLAEGLSLRWDSDRLESYVRKVAEVMYSFEGKVETGLKRHQDALQDIDAIKVLPLDASKESLLEMLAKVQKHIEEQQLQHFSNIPRWTRLLDSHVETILRSRVVDIVNEWVKQFEGWPHAGTSLVKKAAVLEIQLRNHVLQLFPPVEAAHQYWMGELHNTIASVCLVPRLSSRIGASAVEDDFADSCSSDDEDAEEKLKKSKLCKNRTYRHLSQLVDPAVFFHAYDVINKHIQRVKEYVQTWLQYQVLWDVDVNEVISRVSDDIETWQHLLNEIKAARSTFDTHENREEFGATIVDHQQAQSKLNTKYDGWHREILHAFGQKVADRTEAFYKRLHALLTDLEEQGRADDPTETSISAMTFLSMSQFQMDAFVNGVGPQADALLSSLVSNLTRFLLKLQEASKADVEWEVTFESLRASERLLERQRFAFPSDWLWIDRVEGELETFQQLLRHQALLVEQSREPIVDMVKRYNARVQFRLKHLYSEWMIHRPVKSDVSPQHATQVLEGYESQLNQLAEQYAFGEKAKNVLGLDDLPAGDEEQFSPDSLAEEIKDMKGVWNALSSLFTDVGALRETPWATVAPKAVRQRLEELLEKIKKVPPRFRQYDAFEEMRAQLTSYLKLNLLITDLRTDALKDRHWKLILTTLKIKKTLQEVTLGTLWHADLVANESAVREILVQAQGETALEEFLRQVKESWQDRELTFVAYGTKTKLVKGWDDLFQLIDDQVAALQSMKLSPYFKIFEEEALTWEEKLNRLRGLLDSWIEVQRKWVYLEGVFTGSQDIPMLLPQEHQRFRGIDQDFKNIMKKAASVKNVMEVAGMDDLGRQLDRLSDLLSRIQKALGEYLEKQREQFARFYFVGDEDLLEMIGNARDVKVVQRHVNKLFAGIAVLDTDPENGTIIVGMSSKEGESVPFSTTIPILQYASLKDWLAAVEQQMVVTLAENLASAIAKLEQVNMPKLLAAKEETNAEVSTHPFLHWVASYPLQALLLALQVSWTRSVETALAQEATGEAESHPLATGVLDYTCKLLEFLADRVVTDVGVTVRQRMVQIITELVHQRDVCRTLIDQGVVTKDDFRWLQYMRFYFSPPAANALPQDSLRIAMADATLSYGFEYLGMAERLIQTPLTDKCFLTLTQALNMKLGGNPFGPAGTGKTESVKALGTALGRYTLVFNCDETFDFNAMGRLFAGLCQVGAWGCFDEFNRLDEKILSAVSEQILTIQTGLREGLSSIELLDKNVKLSTNVGIFVTMNPGYAGRSNLPDNLKQLFREIAMIVPDKPLIAQVTLFAQGFRSAERLASKIISLFDLCDRQLSKQPHYDFGLRSLKSALNSAGSLKRQWLQDASAAGAAESEESVVQVEETLLLRSVCDTVVPKLVAQDVPLLKSLLAGVFPGADVTMLEEKLLCEEIERLAQGRHMQCRGEWKEKVLQLYQIQKLQHGVMLVGPVGTGKSAAWKVLLDAMERLDGVKGHAHILDPKAVPKEQLYGRLDSTTLEWQDGVFTAILRKILQATAQQQAGSATPLKRHWIVFDGDVDPEWAENLNSVLDDNKLLTLPNGERLQIPSNVRLLFEVDTLKHATLATVSRCGMVWFSDSVVEVSTLFQHHLSEIQLGNLDGSQAMQKLGRLPSQKEESRDAQAEREVTRSGSSVSAHGAQMVSPGFARRSVEAEKARLCEVAAEAWRPYFEKDGFVCQALARAMSYDHIMVPTHVRLVESTISLLKKGIAKLAEYQSEKASEGEEPQEQVAREFYVKWLLLAMLWGFGGSLSLSNRLNFTKEVQRLSPIRLPSALDANEDGRDVTLLDFEPSVEDGEWHTWKEKVKQVEIEPHQVADANLVIQTVDTLRHKHVVEGWLDERRPFILCGPPGSGKTMTLTSVLKERTDFDIAFLNFSSGTTPQVLLKTFDQYCEFTKSPKGMVVMRPTQPGKKLIVFCDECNLPLPDKYGTQSVITFMREIVETGGFWRLMPQMAQGGGPWVWVRVERVQFAGACNPPTDAGRHPMSDRFLRFAPLLFVDFPGTESLRQIYGTFNRAMLRPFPQLRAHAEALTDSMVDFYDEFSRSFTVDMQPHYIYSPRELTRWKLAMSEALDGGDRGLQKSASRAAWKPEMDGADGVASFFSGDPDGARRDAVGRFEPEELDLKTMVRVFVHEGLRIFSDRLVHEAERQKTDQMIDQITLKHFQGVDASALQRPILLTSLVTRRYEEVSRDELRALLQGKLRVFNEEVFNVQLVFFNEVLEHVTRIDRVLRQPLGHLLLVGASGAGKTILTKFVAWMNGLSVFQIKAGRNYNTAAFEQDLRVVMKRAAIKEEKIAFILDESNALGPAFLERMNALLASGEVPGLFEGDEFTALINECKAAYGSGEYLASNESGEIFARFTRLVQRNLHIIFTMNPANPEFYNRQATSPALFNRCVIDWFGDWNECAMLEVAKAFTAPILLPPEGFDADAAVGLGPDLGKPKLAAQVEGEDQAGPVDPDEEARRMRLASSIVAFHAAVALSNKKLQRAGKKSNWMTPRDFLDFLHHFVNLVGEKADATGEQQRHLQAGLQTLRVAEEQVAEMRSALTEKESVLTEKNEEAEKKMGQMVEQQAEAEEKKRGAEQLTRKLDEQTGVIEERRQAVQKQLAEVEPLLREAAEAVTNIPKKSLDELKSMANPPAMAKIAVEAVAVLITDAGEKPLTWEDARKVLKNQDFITKVVNFDCSCVSVATRRCVQTRFIGGGDWDLEKINRASKAAGPLAKWVESSVAFVAISEQVDPLQKEIDVLEVEALKNKEELLQQQELIGQLERKLQQYKKDYAQLISEVQLIQREMEDVQKKCQRSMRLLQNLGSEKGRWLEQSDALRRAGVTFIGDSLLAAAFCAYLGFFEYAHRQRLLDEWQDILKIECIRFCPDLSYVDFLSLPSERLHWVASGLPPDDLSIQNAIILKRFLRYPLVIDPAGQATNFLTQLMAAKKLTKTSFTDQNFLKALEAALRFGTTLLVQDVEKVDPILNSVLNRETHKLGGRELITVGDAEIDLSPAFMLFLATRDPTAQFTPDLCSRVTIVNFTLTPSSLVNQCLNLILKSERPDVDKRRTDMLKLQGEFKVKIRELEDGLLQALSNVKGNILDDDAVLATMENLKQQAAEVEREAARTEDVMAEVEKTSNMYLVWALAAGRIYFMLLNLSCISFFYQYDLRFFLNILGDTLRHPDLEKVGSSDYAARLDFLMERLFSTAYQRLAPGLRYRDRLVVGLEMAHIRAEIELKSSIWSAEMQLLLAGTILKGGKEAGDEDDVSGEKSRGDEDRREWKEDVDGAINAEQMKALQKLSLLPFFVDLETQMRENREDFRAMVMSQEPEKLIPAVVFAAEKPQTDEDVFGVGGKMTKAKWLRHLREILLLRALRPDRVTLLLAALVEAVLGEHFLTVPELTQTAFYDLIQHQAGAAVPVALVSSPGFDPSSKVTALAAAYKQHLTSIAMGSKEGFLLAEKAIGQASRQGNWVLFKNVHLSTKWLQGLEKQLYRMQGVHPNFRIFLTMEATPALPLNLMRVSYTFVFEPPSGVKASLLRSYATMNAESSASHAAKKGATADPGGAMVGKPPLVARGRLQFLLAFLHAVVLERRRYAPVGWCKQYEFSDADQVCALKIINSWVDNVAAVGKGGTAEDRVMAEYIAPERLPWDAIRTLLKQVCYGGRLDNPVDQKILSSLVDYLFQPAAFEASFPLNIMAENEETGADSLSLPQLLTAPDLFKQASAYEAWAEQLWSVDSPTWLGFSAQAERLLASRQSLAAVGSWAAVLLRGNEEAHDFQAISVQGSVTSGARQAARGRGAEEARSLSAQLTSQMSSEMEGAAGSSWLSDLVPGVQAMIGLLPQVVPDVRRTEETVKDPMFRCFEREITVARRLLATIQDALAQLLLVCKGEAKLTNALRDLAQRISSSEVPPEWKGVFTSAPELTLAEWIEDFSRRLKHLMLVAQSFGPSTIEETSQKIRPEELSAALTRQSDGGELSQRRVWLGGLLYPSAYLTASRQAVAQAKGWSLDDLAMEVQIGVSDPPDDQSFVITGVTVEGAAWNTQGQCLSLTESLKASLPPVAIRWWHKDEGPKMTFSNQTPLDVPLFLNHSRAELVAFCKLPFPQDVLSDVWVQRGTSLFLWSDL
ncbi:dynein heavy chain [Toxoplasma gondii GT1]|uniref:Dynein heavy chain, cytoplasmic n=5 Tax=Toxoplasma gondii TaxID=5811 RepID=S7VWW7_TOXGG|nr:dynein heavy chain [Toxoplasma gondii GT1]KAF4646167.1 dynein heavy chain [Toxoplasma gondii]RQX68854.1 dynein heavy chain [Toxoplasma gondii CAST]